LVTDLRAVSDVNVALANVDAFAAQSPAPVAWVLDRFDVIQRLRILLQNPQIIDQRGLNACAPGVFSECGWRTVRWPSRTSLVGCCAMASRQSDP